MGLSALNKINYPQMSGFPDTSPSAGRLSYPPGGLCPPADMRDIRNNPMDELRKLSQYTQSPPPPHPPHVDTTASLVTDINQELEILSTTIDSLEHRMGAALIGPSPHTPMANDVPIDPASPLNVELQLIKQRIQQRVENLRTLERRVQL